MKKAVSSTGCVTCRNDNLEDLRRQAKARKSERLAVEEKVRRQKRPKKKVPKMCD